MSDVSHSGRERPFHFSLQGLFILVLGVACGIGAARLSLWDALDGISAALAIWLMFGLAQQVRDLRRVAGPVQPAEFRTGWSWAVFWRIAVIAGIAVCAGFRIWGRIRLAKGEEVIPADGRQFSEILLAVVLVASLRLDVPRLRGWRLVIRGLSGFAALLVGSAATFILVFNQVLIPWLVHVAIHSVRLAQPYRKQGVSIEPMMDRTLQSTWLKHGPVAGLLLVASLAVLWFVAQRWRGQARAPRLLVALLGGLLVLLAWEIVWAGTHVFPRLSPFMWEALPLWELEYTVPCGIGAIAFAGAAAWRFSVDEAGAVPLVWRQSGRRYCHEFLILWLLPFVGMLAACIWAAWKVFPTTGRISSLLLDVTSRVVSDQRAILWLAVFLTGIVAIADRLHRRGNPWSGQIEPLPAAKFLTLWLAILWVTLLAGPTLLWLATAAWMLWSG